MNRQARCNARHTPAFAGLLLAAAACVQVAANERATETVDRLVVAMGTTLQMQVTASSRAQALVASEAGVQAIEAVTARLSTWSMDSELAALNRLPVGSDMRLSGALLEDLRKARWWQRATGGAFDPGIGALVDLYELRGDGRWPADQDVWACLPHCGLDLLHVTYRRAGRRAARLRIEEGGFAKGAALDAAAEAILAAGATHVSLDFGGQVLRVGASTNEHAYGIASPSDRTLAVVTVRIPNGCLATTANSERRIRIGGRDLGHILDPRTGRPAADFGSITVWAQEAFAADCLSTGLFVMAPDDALRWAEQHPGIEVLVLESSEDSVGAPIITARASSGLRHRVTARVPGVIIQ